MLLFMFNWGPHFSPVHLKVECSWTSRILSKASASPVDAHSPKGSPALIPSRPFHPEKRLWLQSRGLSLPARRKFPPGRIARRVWLEAAVGRQPPSIDRAEPTLLRNSGTLHSAERTASRNATGKLVENMVYSATESVKKRLGSCEKVTMKLRSLLNISSISSTCVSHKRLEESLEVRDREFRLVTRGEAWHAAVKWNTAWLSTMALHTVITVVL